MSVPIIVKSAVFTLIICLVLIGVFFASNTMAYLTHALLVVIVFFLVLDVFEREAVRHHKKV